MSPQRVIVAITGASGSIYGIRALEALRSHEEIETHLVISRGARATIALETDHSVKDVMALADVVHSEGNLSASISSGSFPTRGMLIAPCSIKTLSAVANCHADTLIGRAADVVLKERRPLVLMVRETPLHGGHLRLMQQASELGAVIFPPVPAFYHRPVSLADVVDQTVGRALDQLRIDSELVVRWEGPATAQRRSEPPRSPNSGSRSRAFGDMPR